MLPTRSSRLPAFLALVLASGACLGAAAGIPTNWVCPPGQIHANGTRNCTLPVTQQTAYRPHSAPVEPSGGFEAADASPPYRSSDAPRHVAYRYNRELDFDEAAGFSQFLSPDCARLEEASRTAWSRGLSRETQQSLQIEFRRKCSDELREAQNRYWQLQRQRQEMGQVREQRQQRADERSAQEVQNCREMADVIALKERRVAQMTPNDLQNLERFRQNYLKRCQFIK